MKAAQLLAKKNLWQHLDEFVTYNIFDWFDNFILVISDQVHWLYIQYKEHSCHEKQAKYNAMSQ